MGFIPLSLIVELFFYFMAEILLTGGIVGRGIAVGCYAFTINILTADQVYEIESNGNITGFGLPLPSGILVPAVAFTVFMMYRAMANLFEYLDRDMFGRKHVPE